MEVVNWGKGEKLDCKAGRNGWPMLAWDIKHARRNRNLAWGPTDWIMLGGKIHHFCAGLETNEFTSAVGWGQIGSGSNTISLLNDELRWPCSGCSGTSLGSTL